MDIDLNRQGDMIEKDKKENMFNTFLDVKRRYVNILFWWLFSFGTIVIVIAIYKWAFPIVKTEKVFVDKPVYIGKYETKTITDLGELTNGELVKFGSLILCVSSIDETNLKLNPDQTINIYLREKGSGKCQQYKEV